MAAASGPVSGRSQVRTGLLSYSWEWGHDAPIRAELGISVSQSEPSSLDTGHCSDAVVEVSSVCDVSVRAGLTLGEH